MPISPRLALLIAAFIFCIVPQSHAVEPLSSKELVLHCEKYFADPQGEDAIFCVRYIQGFIDGAVATDERVISNLADDQSSTDNRESFSERAMRVRGRDIENILKRYGATYYADFCLDISVSLKEVVEEIVSVIAKTDQSQFTGNARDLVFTILRDSYPCPSE